MVSRSRLSAVSEPTGPRLCTILQATFREFPFHALGVNKGETKGWGPRNTLLLVPRSTA
jgi:hypothetical protein